MPEVASATLTVTPVLSGAQQSLTEQLTGEASKAGTTAGAAGGKSMVGSLAKGVAAGTAAVGAAVAGVGAAMVGAANNTAAYGDQIDKASQKLGVSAEFYQEWDAVLQHSGTSMDSMSATFKKLANASQDATDDQVKAFQALGLSMDEVASMSSEDLFASVVSGLQNMEEGTERTALATTLLGRGAMEMGALFNTSAEDTQGMIDRVHELGGVMSNDAVKDAAAYQDAMQDMQSAIGGIKNGLAGDLLPVLTDLMNGVGDFISKADLTPLTSTLGKAVSALGNFIKGLDIEAIGKVFAATVETIGDVLGTAWDIMSTIFGAIKDALKTVDDAVGETGDVWDTVWGGIAEFLGIVADFIGATIGVIADAIANLVREAKTEGTVFNAIWKTISGVIKTVVDVVGGVIKTITALFKGDFKGAFESAKGVVTSVFGGIRDFMSNTWGIIKNAATNAWEGIKSAITGPIEAARNTIGGIIERVKSFFPIRLGNIFSGIKLPHFTVSGGEIPWGIGGKGKRPSIGVEWYARAAEEGARFTSPTIIGVGDASQPEILLGEEKLRELTGGGAKVINNITVNGAEDPEAWASRFARQLKMQMRMA